MGMHTIPVVYDPTTRRISLADNTSSYGGATTDVNSVDIAVTGIVPDGTNFKARVDFAVPIKTVESNVINPYVVLEQDNDTWSAVIPNAILAATRDMRGRMPIQLVLANDEQVINSRNSIVLEVTQAIDADSDDVPEYTVPEWTVSEQAISDDVNVHTISVTYDPATRMMALDDDGSRYGGATIDTFSVRINVTGIPADYDARIDFAVPIETEEHNVIKPFVVLEKINTTWCAMIPQAVLMAAKETKKLPFQLVIRHGDTIINSRNTIIPEVTRAINAADIYTNNYIPYLMYRNDTWEWVSDFTYGIGSVVVYQGEMYTSLINGNLGIIPSTHPEAWSLLTGISNVRFAIGNDQYVSGTVVGSQVTFSEQDVVTLTKYTYTPVTLTERDGVPNITVSYDD